MSSAILEKKVTNLGECFFRYFKKYGNRICQIDADTDQSESYSSVCTRSIRLAIQLDKKGINSKSVIACCSYNSMDNLIPVMASIFLGAKVCHLEPTLSLKYTKHILNLSTPEIIFADVASMDLIENGLKDQDFGSEIIIFGQSTKYKQFTDLIVADSDENQFKPVQVDENDIALLYFTSGSTGLPKAVAICHRFVLDLIGIEHKNYLKIDSCLHFVLFYGLGPFWVLGRMVKNGGKRIFSRNLNGDDIFRAIEKYQISAIFLFPSETYQLTNFENPEKYNFSSLQYLFIAGTFISNQQIQKLCNLFTEAKIAFSYGMTETGYIANMLYDFRNQDILTTTKNGCCGRIAEYSRLKVVDVNSEEMLGPNQAGEIRFKSAKVMNEYYKIDNSSYFDVDGYFKTGDIGYLDQEGYLYIVGRLKETFKFKCWHIVPSMIENVFLEHADVKECVVFGVPAEEKGEAPAACIVLKKGSTVTQEELVLFVENRLSEKERLVGGVTIVDQLPKTSKGNIIKADFINVKKSW